MADQLLAEVLHDHPAAPVFDKQATRRNLLPSTSLQAEPQMATHHVEPLKSEREKADENDEQEETAAQKSPSRKDRSRREEAQANRKDEAKQKGGRREQGSARTKKVEIARNEKSSRRRRR